jgi:hypothetical protein
MPAAGQPVDPGAIRWIRPRDAWLLDRKFQQPLKLLRPVRSSNQGASHSS